MRDEVMPALEDMPGCIGMSLLVDRQSGRCIATTSWESEEMMRESADRVRSLRDGAARQFGADSPRVEQWEVGAMHRDHHIREGACAQITWAKAQDLGRFDSAVETYKTMVAAQLEQMPGFCSTSLLIDRETGRGVACETFDSRDAVEQNREQLRPSAAKAPAEPASMCSMSVISRSRSPTCASPNWCEVWDGAVVATAPSARAAASDCNPARAQ